MALASVCAARSIIRMRTIMTFILLCNILCCNYQASFAQKIWKFRRKSLFWGCFPYPIDLDFKPYIIACCFVCQKIQMKACLLKGATHSCLRRVFHPKCLSRCPQRLHALASKPTRVIVLRAASASSPKQMLILQQNSCTSDSVDWGSQLSLSSLTFLLWSREFP